MFGGINDGYVDCVRQLREFCQRERALLEQRNKGGQHVGYSPSINPSTLKRLEEMLPEASK